MELAVGVTPKLKWKRLLLRPSHFLCLPEKTGSITKPTTTEEEEEEEEEQGDHDGKGGKGKGKGEGLVIIIGRVPPPAGLCNS